MLSIPEVANNQVWYKQPPFYRWKDSHSTLIEISLPIILHLHFAWPEFLHSLRQVVCTSFRNSPFCSYDFYLKHSIQSRWASLESHVTTPARDHSRGTSNLPPLHAPMLTSCPLCANYINLIIVKLLYCCTTANQVFTYSLYANCINLITAVAIYIRYSCAYLVCVNYINLITTTPLNY